MTVRHEFVYRPSALFDDTFPSSISRITVAFPKKSAYSSSDLRILLSLEVDVIVQETEFSQSRESPLEYPNFRKIFEREVFSVALTALLLSFVLNPLTSVRLRHDDIS